jgi:uncharacterized coiled-coil protein SlyX
MIALFALPGLTQAQSSSLVANYSKIMSERLAFSLNRNARLYNSLVNKSTQLERAGKNISAISATLAETKIIIDRGQKHLTEFPSKANDLTASSTAQESFLAIRQLVKEIIGDIRLSYAKIKEIKLLIKKIE